MSWWDKPANEKYMPDKTPRGYKFPALELTVKEEAALSILFEAWMIGPRTPPFAVYGRRLLKLLRNQRNGGRTRETVEHDSTD